MYYTRMRYVLFNTSWFGREKKLLKVSKRINNEKIPNILKFLKNIPNILKFLKNIPNLLKFFGKIPNLLKL